MQNQSLSNNTKGGSCLVLPDLHGVSGKKLQELKMFWTLL